MSDYETPFSDPVSESDDSDRALGDRIERLESIEDEIEEKRQHLRDRQKGGRSGSKPEEVPAGSLDGPHARILEPEKRSVEGEPYLEFEIVLPDQTYGVLRTEYPVPAPGPILSRIYSHLGYDPDEATPSDIFKSDIPVRPIEDGPAEGEWVLDLPPVGWFRQHCYQYRRDLEQRGMASWERELSGESDDDGDIESDRHWRLERVCTDGVGFILPHSPNTASWWGPIGYTIAIAIALTGGFIATGEIPLPFRMAEPLMWSGILLAFLLFVVRHYVLTRSVHSEFVAPDLPGDGTVQS